jgi:hypothetical protein
VNRIAPTADQTTNKWATSPLDSALSRFAKQPVLSIVQSRAYIGGTNNSPLCGFLCEQLDHANATSTDRNTKVVLAEPIREYFDHLCKDYGNFPCIEFANVAIAETQGVMDMYRLDVDPVEYGYPTWLAQLSSLKRERMETLWDEYEANPDDK